MKHRLHDPFEHRHPLERGTRFHHAAETGEHRFRGPHGRGRHGRPFDYGAIRLLVLALLAEEPRHGYDLMREIETRMGGSYTPSPGVIYPTLSWLEDMGYAAAEEAEGSRKRFRMTAEGEAFLAANRAAVDDLMARLAQGRPGGREGTPAPVIRAMENLKLALRLRFRQGPLEEATAQAIADALDAAVKVIERS
jgi:DNA-binding PadR family transcriptional regulator